MGCTVIERHYHQDMYCFEGSECMMETELLLDRLDTETSPTTTPEIEVSPTVDLTP